MKKELHTVMFPDFRRLSRADATAFLIYIVTLGILFSTSLSLPYIIAAYILLPVAYITVRILATRHDTSAEETGI